MNEGRETVLVTGGAGAQGVNLVHALRRQGRRVIVLDDLSSGHFPVEDAVDARFIKGRVEDEAALESAFQEPVRVVYHLAALFANQNSVEHPQEDLLVNGLGTLRLLEHAHKAGVRRFVYASSSCVYGPSEGIITEDSRLAAETPYAFTKHLGEQYVTFFREQHGLPAVSFRLFNVFGPGELPGRYRNVIPNFLARARWGEDLLITGDGQEGRTFTFVEDVVAVFLLASGDRLPPRAVYNLASDNYCTIGALAEKVVALTNSRSRIVLGERRAWDHVRARRGSWERLREDLQFLPQVGLDTGLARTLAWLDQVFFPRVPSAGEIRGPLLGLSWP